MSRRGSHGRPASSWLAARSHRHSASGALQFCYQFAARPGFTTSSRYSFRALRRNRQRSRRLRGSPRRERSPSRAAAYSASRADLGSMNLRLWPSADEVNGGKLAPPATPQVGGPCQRSPSSRRSLSTRRCRPSISTEAVLSGTLLPPPGGSLRGPGRRPLALGADGEALRIAGWDPHLCRTGR
jgi:hypothetical protein